MSYSLKYMKFEIQETDTHLQCICVSMCVLDISKIRLGSTSSSD
jgi:hypothetical protein